MQTKSMIPEDDPNSSGSDYYLTDTDDSQSDESDFDSKSETPKKVYKTKRNLKNKLFSIANGTVSNRSRSMQNESTNVACHE